MPRKSKYESRESIINALEGIWKKHPETKGVIPSEYWMRRNNYGYLGKAILRYHDGFRKLRDDLGYENIRKDDKYWDENFIQELNKTIEELGYFPSKRDLDKINKSSLGSKITLHGGYRKVRTEFGYDLATRESSNLKDEKWIKKRLNEIKMKL